MDKIVAFVPHHAVERVVDALAAEGAGALGDYERCTFVSTGTGTFRPMSGAPRDRQGGRPRAGSRVTSGDGAAQAPPRSRGYGAAGRRTRTRNLRSTCWSWQTSRDGVAAGGSAGWPSGFRRVRSPRARPPPCRAPGSVVRVAGDPQRRVETVAVCGGAGDFLLDRARASGADVYVTSDLATTRPRSCASTPTPTRPHRRWSTCRTLRRSGPGCRRWPPGSAPIRSTTTVETRVSELVTDPWTFHLPMTRYPPTGP